MANSFRIIGVGQEEFDIPLAAGTSIVSCMAYYDANYVGPRPKLEILERPEIGVWHVESSMQGPAVTWEQLSVAVNPTSDCVVTARISAAPTDTLAGLFQTPILDNFNRADSPTLGSPWLNNSAFSGLWTISANRAVPNGSVSATAMYPIPLGPWWELYTKILTLPDVGGSLSLRGSVNVKSFISPIQISVLNSNASGNIQIFYLSQFVVLNPTQFSNGDIVGVRVDTRGVTVYRNTGSGWNSVCNFPGPIRDDASSNKSIGITVGSAASTALDDFGGGNITPVSYFDSFSIA